MYRAQERFIGTIFIGDDGLTDFSMDVYVAAGDVKHVLFPAPTYIDAVSRARFAFYYFRILSDFPKRSSLSRATFYIMRLPNFFFTYMYIYNTVDLSYQIDRIDVNWNQITPR